MYPLLIYFIMYDSTRFPLRQTFEIENRTMDKRDEIRNIRDSMDITEIKKTMDDFMNDLRSCFYIQCDAIIVQYFKCRCRLGQL